MITQGIGLCYVNTCHVYEIKSLVSCLMPYKFLDTNICKVSNCLALLVRESQSWDEHAVIKEEMVFTIFMLAIEFCDVSDSVLIASTILEI